MKRGTPNSKLNLNNKNMNFLKNIFSRNGNGSIETIPENEINQTVPEIDEEIFIDEGVSEKKQLPGKEKTRLSEFLERDHYKDGYNDGYDYPAFNILESSIEKLKSDLILIIDKMTDEMNNEIISLTEHSINISDISKKSGALTENRIMELRKLILKLIDEKGFCANNSGRILSVLNNYKSGFEKGLHVCTQEKMLASGKGIF